MATDRVAATSTPTSLRSAWGRRLRSPWLARPLSPWSSVLLGLALAAAGFTLKELIRVLSGHDVAYLPLFALLPVAAVLGGFASGATLVAVGALADAVVFQAPVGSLQIDDPEAFTRFLLFIPVGLWLAWLVGAMVAARRDVAASASRFEGVIDALPELALVVDPLTSRIDYSNEAVGALGWSAHSLATADAETLLPGIHETLAAGHDVATLEFLAPSGESVPVEVLVRPVTLPSGLRRVLVVARDISDRIESEVRLLRLARVERTQAQALQAVIGSMTDGVALIADDGNVLVANDALATIAGRPVRTVEDLPDFLRTASSGTVHLTDPDRWFQILARVLEATSTKVLLVRDTTLEMEQSAARDAYMGVLSHELRTPVTTILGTAHVLAKPRTGGDAFHRELATDIASEAERLNNLIEDLLVLSRAQSGAIEIDPEPVLVQHLVREVIGSEALRYPHVTFRADVPPGLPPVLGDRTAVGQILRNLIGNAGKYSAEQGGEVRIQATFEAGQVSVLVQDNGPGFEPEDADRLFDIFFRSTRTARVRAGSGIGLYVTRTLVTAMGGQVWARLPESGGSEFGFVLPTAPLDESDILSATELGGRGKEEDDDANLRR